MAVAVLLVLVAAGCANRRAVLYQGVHFGISGRVVRVSDADARRDAVKQGVVAARDRETGTSYPRERFANLPSAQLRRRLAALATKYRFVIVSATLLRPSRSGQEVVPPRAGPSVA